jgi:hypothetical protein
MARSMAFSGVMKMKSLLVLILAFLLLDCVETTKKDSGVVSSLPKKNDASLGVNDEHSPPKELKLTSMLYELAIAPEPEGFAKEHSLFLVNGKVRVFILFDPTSSNLERDKLAEDYNIVVEKKSNDIVRALVPIDRLIPLSKESVIWSIRLPDRAIKLGR